MASSMKPMIIRFNGAGHGYDIYLRLFYNGAFSITSKNDFDDQNLLLATVRCVVV
jgi:hypothetical protein